MKKRILAVLAALIVAGTTGAFAAGIGVQGGYNPGNNGVGPALTFKLDSFDGVFAVDANFGGGQLQNVGFSVDYWMQNPRLTGIIHYYWGPGMALSFRTGDPAFNAAFRVVGGINVFPVEFLEVYAQVAWQPGLTICFNHGLETGDNWWNSFPVNAGIRFWF